MKITRTKSFLKSFQQLPPKIQQLYQIQENRFQTNWQDPRLHLKRVKSLPNIFSLRITRRYRAFFYFQDPFTAIFFDIDHRKDAYR